MTSDKKDFDIIIWDTVGSSIDEEAAKQPMGGSEYHLLQLTRGLTERGFRVLVCSAEKQWSPNWRQTYAPEIPSLSCRTLIHSRYSALPPAGRFAADRTVVFATDMPGDASGGVAEEGGAYRHLAPLFKATGYCVTDEKGEPHVGGTPPATLVCLSQWQLGLFPKAWQGTAKVIPMMIDDRAYELGRTTEKTPKRFLYASAAMKGLIPTLQRWVSLERYFPREMKGAELRVTTNWDMPSDECAPFFSRDDITWLGQLPPHQVEEEMASSEGLFYCNEFPETFCAIAALAEACNARAHILCLNSPGGIPEATRGSWVTTDEKVFEEKFIATLGIGLPVIERATPFRDCSVTATIPLWLGALGLDARRGDYRVTDGPFEEVIAGVDRPRKFREAMHRVQDTHGRLFANLAKHDGGDPKKIAEALRQEDERDHKEIQEAFHAAHAKYESDTPPASVNEGAMKNTLEKEKITIGLVMIAKNESTVIQRALESVHHVIDAVTVVVDEKTTDDTGAIVRQWGYDHSVPVWVSRRPWRGGFAATRNEAIEIAKEHRKTTYLLLLDCDDKYEIPLGWEISQKPLLTEKIYDVEIVDGASDFAEGTTYARPALFRADEPFRFEGRHHEYLTHPDGYTCARMPGEIIYRRLSGGSSNATPEARHEKYKREAFVFVEEVERGERDGKPDLRSMYYAGQSFRDAGMLPEAREWFHKRGRAGGYFVEETFMAWMNLGDLLFPETEAIAAYLRAYETVPTRRLEALFGMARVYNERKQFELTWALPDLTTIWGEAPSGLFVRPSIYKWEMDYQYAIAATYLANYGGKLEPATATWLWRKLLDRAPVGQHEGIRKNMAMVKRWPDEY